MLETEDGTVLDARGEAIGVATNNVAEYRGLVEGLRSAVERGVEELEVISDSELIVKQMRGEYRIKNDGAARARRGGRRAGARLRRVTYTAVRRRAQRARRPVRPIKRSTPVPLGCGVIRVARA